MEKAAGLPIFWFRVDEIGSHGGRFHIHALIGNVGHLRRMTWVDKWDSLAGFARILPFDSKKGAAFYCAKYITKQPGEWELSDYLSAFGNNQRTLTLQGGTNQQPPVLSAPEMGVPRLILPSSPQIQHPMPFMLDGTTSDLDNPIRFVYQTEVTRGRSRYKEFQMPDIKRGSKRTQRDLRENDGQRKR
jgi:hypothetical protein